MNLIANFEAMLTAGKDNALLRFGLGNEYLRANNPQAAIAHLRVAVTQDPAYSAAWKLLGRASAQAGDVEAAKLAYQQGIDAATARGDKQAAKEMTVFLRRLSAGPSLSVGSTASPEITPRLPE